MRQMMDQNDPGDLPKRVDRVVQVPGSMAWSDEHRLQSSVLRRLSSERRNLGASEFNVSNVQ